MSNNTANILEYQNNFRIFVPIKTTKANIH